MQHACECKKKESVTVFFSMIFRFCSVWLTELTADVPELLRVVV